MLIELKKLLSPFQRGFAFYILFTLIRQGLVVGGGYGLVLLIRNFEHNPTGSVLIALPSSSPTSFSSPRSTRAWGGHSPATSATPCFASSASTSSRSSSVSIRVGISPVAAEHVAAKL